jgi:probable rRNA maturation factor
VVPANAVVGDALMTIEVNDESGEDVDAARLADLSRFVLDRMRIHPLAELSVLAVDTDTMTTLHEKWMDEPGPTDVLSFPMDELRPGRDGEPEVEGILGDMLLCPQYAIAQAPQFSRTPEDEMHLLTIHGILHLLGYDHAEPEEEKEMFGLQARLLAEWQGVRSGEEIE